MKQARRQAAAWVKAQAGRAEALEKWEKGGKEVVKRGSPEAGQHQIFWGWGEQRAPVPVVVLPIHDQEC
jgi:hypothetical protein